MANHEILKLVILTALLLLLPARSAASWAKTVVNNNNEHTTTLRFYFHDIVSGKSPTAVQVAKPVQSSHSPTGFGILMMADDPLTDGPDPESKLVGRAQGLYGSTSRDEVGLLMALCYTFTDGQYNGSSINVMGHNSALHPVREMAVVGGTGLFRMVRGYAEARTYWLNKNGDAIVGYNVTLLH